MSAWDRCQVSTPFDGLGTHRCLRGDGHLGPHHAHCPGGHQPDGWDLGPLGDYPNTSCEGCREYCEAMHPLYIDVATMTVVGFDRGEPLGSITIRGVRLAP